MLIDRSDVQLTVHGKTAKAYLAEPENGGPGILLLHAWWGLKPFFKQVCDRLAEEGFIALAPDLRNGQIAQTIDEAKELMEKSDGHLTGEMIEAAKEVPAESAGSQRQENWRYRLLDGCGLVAEVASNAPDQVAATVLFYGSGEVDLGRIRSKVLGHYSDMDEWEPYDEIQQMERKMKAAGVDVEFHIYPGMAHWFVEEDRPEFDRKPPNLPGNGLLNS